MADSILLSAQLHALASVGPDIAPLNAVQALLVIVHAVHAEADGIDARVQMTAEQIRDRLTIAGIRAVRQAQAGMLPQQVLVSRIESLPQDQKIAHSLRYEHSMSDAEIAATMGITEDAVVALMLRSLTTLTGVAYGSD